jgi:hypothetical protein
VLRRPRRGAPVDLPQRTLVPSDDEPADNGVGRRLVGVLGERGHELGVVAGRGAREAKSASSAVAHGETIPAPATVATPGRASSTTTTSTPRRASW